MENVEARLASLELAVTELRKQLDHERTRIRTMRQTHECPACGGKRILHFTRIEELDDSEVKPLVLERHWRFFHGWQSGGPLELFACRACGFIEWQAPALDKVEADGKHVVELVHDEPPASERDPYR